jgi:predicted transcriptional regulator
MPDYIASIRPRWAEAFFRESAPKKIELRKGSFGASLRTNDRIVVYSTLPNGEAIGTIKVVERKILPVAELWHQSQQGFLAKVSESEFQSYYLDRHFGIGVWIEEALLWGRAIKLVKLREILGEKWQPPQQLQKLPENFVSQYSTLAGTK